MRSRESTRNFKWLVTGSAAGPAIVSNSGQFVAWAKIGQKFLHAG
jgi:hypothetical protein